MVLNSTPAGKAKLLQGKKLNYWQRRHQVNWTFLCISDKKRQHLIFTGAEETNDT